MENLIQTLGDITSAWSDEYCVEYLREFGGVIITPFQLIGDELDMMEFKSALQGNHSLKQICDYDVYLAEDYSSIEFLPEYEKLNIENRDYCIEVID